jgi:hypothetical protein
MPPKSRKRPPLLPWVTRSPARLLAGAFSFLLALLPYLLLGYALVSGRDHLRTSVWGLGAVDDRRGKVHIRWLPSGPVCDCPLPSQGDERANFWSLQGTGHDWAQFKTLVVDPHDAWLQKQAELPSELQHLFRLNFSSLANGHFDLLNLRGSDLSHTSFSDTTIGDGHFEYCSLRNTRFHGAKISTGSFVGVDAVGSDFACSTLGVSGGSGVYFSNWGNEGSRLAISTFECATATNVHFGPSDLAGVDFTAADLSGADFTGTDLLRVDWEPRENPQPFFIARAVNLSRLVYHESNRTPILKLKRALQDCGYARAARQVNAAIQQGEATTLEMLLFGLPCEFGAAPARPLIIAVALWLAMGFVYRRALRASSRDGLFLLVPRIPDRGDGRRRIIRLVVKERLPGTSGRLARWVTAQFRGLNTGLLYSTLSSLSLGFKEFSFGQWFRMALPNGIDIVGKGWPRVLGGIQSVLTLYLLALAILCYFGRPFDVDARDGSFRGNVQRCEVLKQEEAA